jgi:toluene monooxygenase system protein E
VGSREEDLVVSRKGPPLKTYSHLAGNRRIPTEYEIVSTGLLYYPRKGFEVKLPAEVWYDQHQRGGRLRCGDWDRFHDPRATTYPDYTALQSRQEAHIEGVLRSWEGSQHDPALVAEWRDSFVRLVAPLRFAFHGLQMIAAYVGQMAPGGRIVMAALFQTADELRRVHGIARHLGGLRRAWPTAGDESRAAWQTDPAWQPLRRAVETALVAYDWGEALVALNLCLAPLVEGLFVIEVGRLARERRDFLMAELLFSLSEDGRWHQAWTAELLRLLFAEEPENRQVVQAWIAKWYPAGLAAVRAGATLLGADGTPALAQTEVRTRQWHDAMGLVTP